MTVVFKGGNSGNRQDASPPVPSKGYAQPIQHTETNAENPNAYFQAAHFEHDHINHATPDFMPSGGTEAVGSDLEQQDIRGLGQPFGDSSEFRGAPDTGTKGGPA